jgi:chromosome segregation ATPase
LKIDLQVKEREEQEMASEVELLRKKKTELLHLITTSTDGVAEGHQQHTKYKEDIHRLKGICQELRINIEERKRKVVSMQTQSQGLQQEVNMTQEKLDR